MKEIVISRMYSGEYLDANLGHEVINLFKADDGKHYIYLNHDGRYSNKHVNNGLPCCTTPPKVCPTTATLD